MTERLSVFSANCWIAVYSVDGMSEHFMANGNGARGEFRHYASPLHVYCRMRDCKIPKGLALIIGKSYGWVYDAFFLNDTSDFNGRNGNAVQDGMKKLTKDSL